MKRHPNWQRRCTALWSGGIDSTSLVANLLSRGYDVTAVTLSFGGEYYRGREAEAREALLPKLKCVAVRGACLHTKELEASWLASFSPNNDPHDVPSRNKRIIDFVMARLLIPQGDVNLGMGEYVGVDTWVVRDHVAGADCDHRSLTAYLWHEYGPDYRLMSLQDFGESRYKSDRLGIGVRVLGVDTMALTTNCLHNVEKHCGKCYKCAERHAAFTTLYGRDPTVYAADPMTDPEAVGVYARQFKGEAMRLNWARWDAQ